MNSASIVDRCYKSSVNRKAIVVAEFNHPETDAPMITWYQTSPFKGEKPAFYSWSKKEFLNNWNPCE